MSGDIFDGVSLENLANSESPIIALEDSGIKQGDQETQADTASTSKDAENPKEIKQEDEDPNAIDISVLAESGDEASTEEEGDAVIKTSSQAPTNDKGTKSPSSQNSDATTSLASALAEVGAFSSLEEEEINEITNAETLVAAMRKQMEDNRYEDLTETQKNYLDALKEGVPERSFHNAATNAAQYESVSEEQIQGNSALVTELIRRSLVIKGVENETALETAKLQASKGNATELGINARNQLAFYEHSKIKSEIDSAKSTREAKETADADAMIELKAKIQQASEILPGIKVNTQIKNRIFDSMTTVVHQEDDGAPLNELMKKYQEDPEFRYKLHAIDQLTKGLTDFKKFKVSAKSSAVENLAEQLKSGNNKRSGSPDPNSGSGRTAKEIAQSLPSNFGRK